MTGNYKYNRNIDGHIYERKIYLTIQYNDQRLIDHKEYQ